MRTKHQYAPSAALKQSHGRVEGQSDVLVVAAGGEGDLGQGEVILSAGQRGVQHQDEGLGTKNNNNFTASRSRPRDTAEAERHGYLSVSVQRREVEEERLSQGHTVDGVVQIVAPVQLHLTRGEEGV